MTPFQARPSVVAPAAASPCALSPAFQGEPSGRLTPSRMQTSSYLAEHAGWSARISIVPVVIVLMPPYAPWSTFCAPARLCAPGLSFTAFSYSPPAFVASSVCVFSSAAVRVFAGAVAYELSCCGGASDEVGVGALAPDACSAPATPATGAWPAGGVAADDADCFSETSAAWD